MCTHPAAMAREVPLVDCSAGSWDIPKQSLSLMTLHLLLPPSLCKSTQLFHVTGNKGRGRSFHAPLQTPRARALSLFPAGELQALSHISGSPGEWEHLRGDPTGLQPEPLSLLPAALSPHDFQYRPRHRVC